MTAWTCPVIAKKAIWASASYGATMNSTRSNSRVCKPDLSGDSAICLTRLMTGYISSLYALSFMIHSDKSKLLIPSTDRSILQLWRLWNASSWTCRSQALQSVIQKESTEDFGLRQNMSHKVKIACCNTQMILPQWGAWQQQGRCPQPFGNAHLPLLHCRMQQMPLPLSGSLPLICINMMLVDFLLSFAEHYHACSMKPQVLLLQPGSRKDENIGE